MKIVSKGGSLTGSVMKSNEVENPFRKNFEYIIELVKEHDIVLNLGNAMRSGCIHDKVDEFQLSEIKINNKLAKKANKKGVQVILESLGGHIKANDIIKWVKIHKKLTNNRPLFVSGPLPIDIGTGSHRYRYGVRSYCRYSGRGICFGFWCRLHMCNHTSRAPLSTLS